MKKISFYIALLIGVLVSWSCEEESNMDEVGNWEITAPALSTPTSGSGLVLSESAPTQTVDFQWEAAATTNRFGVAYRFLLVDGESTDFTDPIMEMVPSGSGKDRFIKLTADQIDYALWAKCYPAGEVASVKWVVVAKAIEKEAVASSPVNITRFNTERVPTTLFITGVGSEAGADVANATPMRGHTNTDGESTGVFDVYTTLNEGQTYSFRDKASLQSRVYGGNEGTLTPCGTGIIAPETATYRVTVNLNDNTFSLWKVDKWSLVGDAVPGGWGGDAPLAYKGNGVWESQIEFSYPYDGAGFIFRANGDWGYVMKQVKGTVAETGLSGNVILESEAGSFGVEVEDSKTGTTGLQTVTLDLSAGAYTFSVVPVPIDPGDIQTVIGKTTNLEADAVSGNFVLGEYEMPDQLFLLSGGDLVAELTKDGMTFKSKYLPLQASKTYTLNSASDGSGTTYLDSGNGEIPVDHDQAYTLTVDFETGKLFWKHYNMKLFHWDEAGGGWDQRQELLMTYTHPYKFEVTGTLTAGFDSKFNSPWDVQFGTTSMALSGTMVSPGENYKGIVQNGSYKATLVVNEDYTSAEYAFVKQ